MTKTKKAPQAVAAAQSTNPKDQLHNTAADSEMQDKGEEEILARFRDAREAGRSGEVLTAFKELTASSTPEEINACVEASVARLPEFETIADDPDLKSCALLMVELMAKSYVQGMREAREAAL
ncbi:hypothetical protein [Anaerotruncus rubiinfantis]|uniref:hypothetical protein n=1 Tax=Anaerotruncus rubiinfantis TaxID=1720200 RepID=UPI0034A2C420